MAVKPRKKWRVEIDDGRIAYSFPSERKAFEYANTNGRSWAAREIRILVDEGRGRGWELFERLSPEGLPL